MAACHGKNQNEVSSSPSFRDAATILEDDEQENGDGYTDGTWCADVEYYNPNTATRHTYQLNVEVEAGELTEIHWPNGGWLDESHFTAEDISDGECSFVSDKGYRYTITLTSQGGCTTTDGYRMRRDAEEEMEGIICSECGREKGDYEELCRACKRKKEAAETCPKCYGYKNDWEPICSSCKDDAEEAARNDSEDKEDE